jgi:putative flippase GtrA
MIRSLQEWEERFLLSADRRLPRIAPYLRRHARVARFILSGGTAAVVDLGLLYFFTEEFGLHYLTSATLAFIAAFGVSFVLQKFWTFQDASTDRVHVQASLSFVIAVINLGINAGLMYFFVDVLGVWYMAAQIIVGAMLAFESFFILKLVIFRASHANTSDNHPNS